MTTLEKTTIEATLTIMLRRAFENGINPEQAIKEIYEGVKNGREIELMKNVRDFFINKGL